MRIRRTVRIPLYPLIPIVPMALMIGSLATAIHALARVRRLEHQLAA